MTTPAQELDLVDGAGQPIRLGNKLGQGGEGSVYELPASPGIVAKIYHRPPKPVIADKIRTMAALRTDQIDRLAAWPLDVVRLRSGAPVGLTMPQVTGCKDIHRLFSPKSRRREFPQADWRFLVRAAANLARAFAMVHETSSVIADVNQGGVLVGQDARIRLIDCDSFQVTDGGKRYLCEVGVATFTPPELQGRPFAELVRTANHDNFGLAVLVFLILFMGRHPFAGRHLGIGEMTIEHAIGDGRFPYGEHALGAQMERPPGAPPLGIVSEPVARLFERAFAREAPTKGRPTAQQWVDALETLERNLRQCSASAMHWHHAGLIACPWCQMEAATGVPLFSSSLSAATAAYFDPDSFWPQVSTLPHPGSPPPLEDAVPNKRKIRPSVEAISFKRRYWFHVPLALFIAGIPVAAGVLAQVPDLGRIFFFASALILYFLVRRALKATINISTFLERDRQQRARWDSIGSEWEAKAGPRRFEDKRAELERLWTAWTSLAARRAAKLDEIGDRKRDIQLARHLDRFELAAADIPGVGTGRKSLLQSFGMETAADVSEARLQAIPGFDVRLQSSVLTWRRALEAKFTFDPAGNSDEQDRQAIEQEILAERLRIGLSIRTGFGELQQIERQIQFARSHLRPRGEEAYRAYLQAEADLKAVSR